MLSLDSTGAGLDDRLGVLDVDELFKLVCIDVGVEVEVVLEALLLGLLEPWVGDPVSAAVSEG